MDVGYEEGLKSVLKRGGFKQGGLIQRFSYCDSSASCLLLPPRFICIQRGTFLVPPRQLFMYRVKLLSELNANSVSRVS